MFDNYIQDASYLTGMVAGAMTKKDNIGMVGGYPIPEVNRLMNAFMAGVNETGPTPNSRSPSSAPGSIRRRPRRPPSPRSMPAPISSMPSASACRMRPRSASVLAIGNVIDTQADYPDTVVASALWHFEPTLDAAIKAVQAGSFKAEDYGAYSFMKAGGCSLSPLGTFEGKVPADVVAKVAEKEEAIKAGSFTVAIDDGEPKSS